MSWGQPEKMTLRFVGTGACVPDVDDETACLLLNDDTLVDAGWCAALHMRRFGCDPARLRSVFLTHCHHDHYLGLAALLFYRNRRQAESGERGPSLVVVGPRAEVARAVRLAQDYLQWDRYPEVAVAVEVVGLAPGQTYSTDRFDVSAVQAVHPTLALCYRFEDRHSGAAVAVTGDTAYHPPLARHAAGVDVLVHEATYGAASADPLAFGGHSGAIDAARIAEAAKPKRLYLVHWDRRRHKADDVLRAAREIFPATHLPQPGDVLELPLG